MDDKKIDGVNVVEEQPPVDAEVIVSMSKDYMEASILVNPPQNGGREVDMEMLHMALAKAGVSFGLDQMGIVSIAVEKLYGVETVVAKGKPKEDGVDAVIEEKYPRQISAHPTTLEDGTVDFKNMNIIRDIGVGVLLVQKTPAIHGEDGTRVDGKTIKCVHGRDININVGQNTHLSDDGNELYSSTKGHLIFDGRGFSVLTKFVVDGNVDNNTGDLEFSGDIHIKGDILEGYTVSANGNVLVNGSVSGGIIIANGNVVVEGGFNGMAEGNITAGKSIKARFLQNCKATAGENIVTETVVNSTVGCDGELVVTNGRGAIIGGKCSAMHRIEAKEIGSEVNTPTQIYIGVSAKILKERNSLEEEITKINEENDLIAKNLEFVEIMLSRGEPAEKYEDIRTTCAKQKAVNMLNLSKLTQRFNEIEEAILTSGKTSEVKVGTVYPSTKITIGNCSTVIKTEQYRAVFRVNSESEMSVSTY